MSLTMTDKDSTRRSDDAWSSALQAELQHERLYPNPQVGTELLSETERTRVWIIRRAPGERIGFHRHVLDYFWTSISGGRGRQHVNGGGTVEYTYAPGETRHETYAKGEHKVHDLENIGENEIVFITVEFKSSANSPLPLKNASSRRE